MKKLARVVLLLALAGCGSSGKPRSLIPIDITVAPEVGTVSSVRIFVSQGTSFSNDQTLAWTAMAGQPMKVGMYVPDSVEGSIDVWVEGQDGSGTVIGRSSTQQATVHSGQTAAVVSLRIERVVPGDGGVEPDAAPLPDGAQPPDTSVMPDASGDAVKPDAAGDGPPPTPDVPPMTGLTWTMPENLENDSLSRSRQPNVAIDGAGNALVAWSEGTAVRTRRWDAKAKAWGDAKMVVNQGDVNTVNLGMGANGHATVVWNYNPSTAMMGDQGLWASHSKDGGNTWSPPNHVHTGPMYARAALAVSRDGHARAAWEESAMNIDSLWSARYDDTTGTWADVAMVKVGNNPYDRYPKLAMDAQGGGLLVWLQGDAMDTNDSTWGSSFGANQALKPAQPLETFTTDDTAAPAVAITSDGSKGVAIWIQKNSSGYDLFTADFTGGAYKTPEKFMSFPSWVSDPAVALDQAGTLTAVWTQSLNSGKSNLVAARRLAGQPWGAPSPIETTNQAGGFTDEDPVARVKLDSAGNVFVAWSRKLKASLPMMEDFSFGIVTRRFAGGMWQPEQALAMKTGLAASDPELAVSDDGRAAIGFVYFDPGMTGDADAYNMFALLYK
ncbi:MAG TPA: hypothetical protein VN914_19125 [Polyangia bacterium]|nr:hypothetical protein [Polyangia bacterium]